MCWERGWNEFIQIIQNDTNAYNYLRMDILCLQDLYVKFDDIMMSFINQYNLNITSTTYPTIGSFTYNANKKMLKMMNNDLYKLTFSANVNKDMHDFARQGLCAG